MTETLPNLVIGTIDVGAPVILAPMSGVTDLPFRKMAKSLGAGLVVSEMIASNEALRETEGTFKRITGDVRERPHMVQIAGHDPQLMADTARFCVDKGADIVDINFGCPAKKVTNKFCGSALMKDVPQATAILQAVKDAVSVPVTVKMRTGWDQDHRNAPEIAGIAQDIGFSMVTVHGRTREQKYTGSADWDYIAKVREVLSIPLIVNGDITDPERAKTALEKSGANGVMVGRGAYGRPWILKQIIDFLKTGSYATDPDLMTRLRIMLEHYDLMLAHHGEDRGVRMSRKHLSWYLSGLHGSAKVRDEIMNSSDPEEVRQILAHYFETLEARAQEGQENDVAA